jgi:cytochrome c
MVTVPTAASAEDGKALFTSAKCNSCHSVSAQGIEAKKSAEEGEDEVPDLSKFGAKGVDSAKLKAFLLKEDKLDGKKHKKKFKGEDADLDKLVQWLGTLK